MNHDITNKEKLRQDIEKILWREYSEDHSPNFEEVSEEIMALFCHQQPEKECDNCKLVEKNKVGYCAMHPKPKEENKCYPPLANEKYLLSITHPEPSREWEERFNELLLDLHEQSDFSKYMGSFHCAKVKEFITNLLLSERTALVEEIEKHRDDLIFTKNQTAVQRDVALVKIFEAQINAHNDIINLITKNK